MIGGGSRFGRPNVQNKLGYNIFLHDPSLPLYLLLIFSPSSFFTSRRLAYYVLRTLNSIVFL